MRGSEFTFDSVQLMDYKCHKVNFRHVGGYIKSHPERFTNIKPFINEHIWK